jgi:hypothetical protein
MTEEEESTVLLLPEAPVVKTGKEKKRIIQIR